MESDTDKDQNALSVSSGETITGDRQRDSVVGVFLVLFFSIIGTFFAFWLFAHKSVAYSLLITFAYIVGYAICIFLSTFMIGIPLLLALFVLNMVHVYKSIKSQS
ncbi:MAG TPA: hypothetical protein DCR21_06530 [Succinivibrionaceae bacterium]|nr:hypothetical protein [Succinivibrio sp.]HAR80473.1 hypothetical protein [Succinivibrionaceae bacterium]